MVSLHPHCLHLNWYFHQTHHGAKRELLSQLCICEDCSLPSDSTFKSGFSADLHIDKWEWYCLIFLHKFNISHKESVLLTLDYFSEFYLGCRLPASCVERLQRWLCMELTLLRERHLLGHCPAHLESQDNFVQEQSSLPHNTPGSESPGEHCAFYISKYIQYVPVLT